MSSKAKRRTFQYGVFIEETATFDRLREQLPLNPRHSAAELAFDFGLAAQDGLGESRATVRALGGRVFNFVHRRLVNRNGPVVGVIALHGPAHGRFPIFSGGTCQMEEPRTYGS